MTGWTGRLAAWVLRRSLPAAIVDDALGDLEERGRAEIPPGPLARVRLISRALSLARQAVLARWRARLTATSTGITRRGIASLVQDVRFAFRLLRRKPFSAAAMVTTLALGIGATVALFAATHAWILRPLPFADPSRLVIVWETIPSADIFENTPAPVVLTEWRARTSSFERLAPFTLATVNLTGTGEPQRLQTLRVSADLPGVLGLIPSAGRAFVDADAGGPSAAVAMISHAFWQAQLGGRPDAVGQVLRLDGRPVEIVGVLPQDSRLLSFDVDLWLPLVLTPEQAVSGNRFLWVVGRLAPGVSVEQASAEVDRIALDRSGGDTGGRVVGLHTQTVGAMATDVLVLLGASGLVLLIACANVANLTLAQGLGRRRELVTRTALGASRGRLTRQVLVECLAISGMGGAAGLLVASWASRSVATVLPNAGRYGAVDVFDPAVVGFAVGASVLTACLFGVVSAWHSTGGDLAAAIREGGRGASGRQRTMRALVIGEVAIAVVLLAATGLVLRSFQNVSRVALGFDATGLVTMELPRPAGDDSPRFFEELEAALGTMPVIRGVALSQALPLVTVGAMGAGFAIEGRTAEESPLAYWRVVNADYFAALRIPLRGGRTFTSADRDGSLAVAIVSESFARRAWPDGGAVGRRIGWGTFDAPLTVVGVVGDVRHTPAMPAGPHVYMPYRQQTQGRLPVQLAVRADAEAAATVDLVRAAVRRIDEGQPIARMRTSEELLDRARGARRFHLVLFASFAGVAVLLAVVGLYGVLSFLVAQRRRELGIRLALGATPAGIRRLWLRQSLGLTIAGLIVGLGASLAGGRLLEGFLFDLHARDAATHAAAAALVLLTAAIASLGPSRRAGRIDPIEPLRDE